MSQPRIISFYLPQYYPTPENDEWWQKGFTEWTNVGRAKPLFKGHYQPKVPADLGYYDLRVEETREEQAKLAREAGIEGFCYWHYWFNGKQLLNRVFTETVNSGRPNFPFCLCWANHSWFRKNWDPTKPNILLIEQTYPGEKDYVNHFNSLLPAFKDNRYIKVNNMPIFGIYRPLDIPDIDLFISTWQTLAKDNGIPGIYFLGFTYEKSEVSKLEKLPLNGIIFDYMVSTYKASVNRLGKRIKAKLYRCIGKAITFDYKDYVYILKKQLFINKNIFPCIIPNFDHSPRSGNKYIIIVNSLPKYFGELCKWIFCKLKSRDEEKNLVFIKAWNEWGEGNYMEPDLKFGKGYIEQLKKATEETKI